MPDLSEGLVIVAAGIGGVFANLLVLMVVVMLIGRFFGKKPSKKKG
jgi:Na+-transporting methylmalonyl-CoA/oxaloacetate decarboxylase gamma subunit